MARTFEFSPPGFQGGAKGASFDSLSDLSEWIAAKGSSFIPSGWGSTREARARLLTGHDKLVAKSDAMLALIEAASPIAIHRPETINSVTGAMPNVPAYLSGSPMSMRLRRKREELAPLTIVVNVASSAAIGDETLERRGAATLALLRKLEGAGHPVELWIMHGVAGSYSREDAGAHSFVKMETRPLDLIRTAWALGSAQFSRECIYSANCTLAHNGELSPWPWMSKKWAEDANAQKHTTACAMGLDPASMLYLPMLYSVTLGRPFANDQAAIDWVNRTYAEAIAAAGILL